MKPVHPRISKASTLDHNFYFSDDLWELSKERLFANTWQWIGKESEIFSGPTNVFPFNYMDHFLEEPLLLVRHNETVHCMSNVCTHRGFLLCHHPDKVGKIVCKYHGRRFDLNGKMEHMPEFKEVENFPRPCEHLNHIALKSWNGFLFSSLNPAFDFETLFKKIDSWIGFLPLKDFRYTPEYDKSYNVQAHWALYCDNFLEGFHIPFVHETLRSMIAYGSYKTICDEYFNIQIGYSDGDTPWFDLPQDHPEYGKKVAAFYFWIFPNFMLNFYPWGVQLNVIQPVKKDFTKVKFYHYIYNESLWKQMDGEQVAEKTEREDEWVVEGVQKGLQSRYYPGGRFSPTREQGVHHFHKLLQEFMTLHSED